MGERQVQDRLERDVVIEKIIAKEDEKAHLLREINRHKKTISAIEQSNTWKVAKAVSLFKRLINRLFGRNKTEVIELQNKLSDTKRELADAKARLNELNLQDNRLNRYDIEQLMREMKNDAQLLNHLDGYISQKNTLQTNYQTALTYIARLYMNQPNEAKKALYEKIMNGLAIEEIPEFMIRAGLSEEPIPLTNAASFRASLSMRMRKKQLQGDLPEFKLDDKATAYRFVKALDIPVPRVDEITYQLSNLPQREGIVIKPSDGAGARGVYLVHQLDDIFDVKRQQRLTSIEELLSNLHDDLATGAVAEDKWLVEEIIYENKQKQTAARDIKFYTFYGRVGAVLEIKRDPEVRQCWWNGEGERILTGKYEESLFQGDGVTAAEIAMVERLSKEIPAPFLRIDFLRSEAGLIFGEFTPKPGDYHDFDKKIDQQLGDYFLQAEANLTEDLLAGKSYSQFMSLREKELISVKE